MSSNAPRKGLGYLTAILTHPLEELAQLPQTAAFWVRLSISCFRKLRRDHAPQMAAALVYQTLLSLIPMAVLGLMLFQSMQGPDEMQALRTTVVNLLLPDSLLNVEADRVEADRVEADVLEIDSPRSAAEFDGAREVLRERLDEVFERLSSVNFAGIGLVGFLIFVYGATALMDTIESSFNTVYHAEETRSLSTRLPLYFTVITLGPLAIVGAQVIQNKIIGIGSGIFGTWLSAPLAFLAPLAVTWFVLAVVFRLVPNTHVHWRSAAIGALITAFTWLLFQELFGLYLSSTALTSLYGALALVPFFLLWLYGSWLLLLFGLEIAFSLQYMATAGAIFDDNATLPIDPRWHLQVLACIAAAFSRGETLTTIDLARDLDAPPRLLRPQLLRLEKEGFIHRNRGRGGQSALTLARPAASISVDEILALAATSPAKGPAAAHLANLAADQNEATEGVTLKDVLDAGTAPPHLPADSPQ